MLKGVDPVFLWLRAAGREVEAPFAVFQAWVAGRAMWIGRGPAGPVMTG